MKKISTKGIKITSSLKNVDFSESISISDNISTKEGSVLLVDIIEINSKYNKIELQSGRIVQINRRDKLVCSIGNRMASDGMCGIVPQANLSVGREIAVLNIGGIIGEQISYNKSIGIPTYCRIIGQVVDEQGKALNIKDYSKIKSSKKVNKSVPVIGYIGTSMNSGKTTVMSSIINIMKNSNINVAAIKVTGATAQKDIYHFLDNGATFATSFLDCGLLSTCVIDKQIAIDAAKGMVNFCNKLKDIDVIFIEFGDCLYGNYNVREILEDKDMKSIFAGLILCCYDVPGSLKLYKDLKDIGLNPLILSGPVTNNSYTLSCALQNYNINIDIFDNLNNINPNTRSLTKIMNFIGEKQ